MSNKSFRALIQSEQGTLIIKPDFIRQTIFGKGMEVEAMHFPELESANDVLPDESGKLTNLPFIGYFLFWKPKGDKTVVHPLNEHDVIEDGAICIGRFSELLMPATGCHISDMNDHIKTTVLEIMKNKGCTGVIGFSVEKGNEKHVYTLQINQLATLITLHQTVMFSDLNNHVCLKCFLDTIESLQEHTDLDITEIPVVEGVEASRPEQEPDAKPMQVDNLKDLFNLN